MYVALPVLVMYVVLYTTSTFTSTGNNYIHHKCTVRSDYYIPHTVHPADSRLTFSFTHRKASWSTWT